MFVAIADLVRASEFFVVLVADPERLADLFDDVLAGRRVVTPWCLIAGRVGTRPVRIDVAACERRASFGVIVAAL